MAWYHILTNIRRVHANTDAKGRPCVHIRGENPGGKEPENVSLRFQDEEHMESFIEAMRGFREDTVQRFADHLETDGGGYPYEVGIRAFTHEKVIAESDEQAKERALEQANVPRGWDVSKVSPSRRATDGGSSKGDGERGRNIVGDKRSSGERDVHDFYPTPPYVTRALLNREDFKGPIWEPAAGNGAMAKVLERAGFDVIPTELQDAEYVYGEGGVDFTEETRQVPTIITNPPFKLAKEFAEHAINCATDRVALFAKLVFLESVSRYHLFQKHPPSEIYVFSKRVTLSKYGEDVENGSMVAYAWFVWDVGDKSKPSVEWILTDPDQQELNRYASEPGASNDDIRTDGGEVPLDPDALDAIPEDELKRWRKRVDLFTCPECGEVADARVETLGHIGQMLLKPWIDLHTEVRGDSELMYVHVREDEVDRGADLRALAEKHSPEDAEPDPWRNQDEERPGGEDGPEPPTGFGKVESGP